MQIIFPSEVYKRLRAYVLAVDTEISFLGKVNRKDKVLTVEDIVLLKQQVTGGNTILDKNALGMFYEEMMQRKEDPSPWKVWIHSHTDMDAYFSSIDNGTIESFDLETPLDNWFLSIVTNHAGKIKARLDVFSPYRYTFNNLDWDISFDDPNLINEVKKEISEKVQEVKYFDGEKVNWREVLERMKHRRLPASIILPGEID